MAFLLRVLWETKGLCPSVVEPVTEKDLFERADYVYVIAGAECWQRKCKDQRNNFVKWFQKLLCFGKRKTSDLNTVRTVPLSV